MLPTESLSQHAVRISSDIPPASTQEKTQKEILSRKDFVNTLASFCVANLIFTSKANAIPAEQKSYSSNARNLERLANGDSSGGSIYNNFPTTAPAAKRRAMIGCKTDSARKRVAILEGLNGLSERECNLRVMDGDTEFMLKALRELDCPTCPFGINGA